MLVTMQRKVAKFLSRISTSEPSERILYVVHCVDTEGPLNETLEATFERIKSIFGISIEPSIENLEKLQNKLINLGGQEETIAECISPEMLSYNSNWEKIDAMLDIVTSTNFRLAKPDSFGNGWVFSWHCMDHMGIKDNPREKDLGYGKIFKHYQNYLRSFPNKDEINWHFHPLSISRGATNAATSYNNSMAILLEILCRRVIEDSWFPVVNRPGFHSERPDSHLFLEQWIPFDYANQFTSEVSNQPDLKGVRFGDWSRSPKTWRGYHPSISDYQLVGNCERSIFRCLNVGTRLRTLQYSHVIESFSEADSDGGAILAFADHDWRDIKKDVEYVQEMIKRASELFPRVKVKYAGAEEAVRSLYKYTDLPEIKLEMSLNNSMIIIQVTQGEIFGHQPFLAIKTKNGGYFHDNLDTIEPKLKWSYTLDEQTIPLESISQIAAASAGKTGKFSICKLDFAFNAS
jgi:hypothetical protein